MIEYVYIALSDLVCCVAVQVGSRAVVQVSGLIMIVVACVGKFSAVFVAIPEPIVGGLFLTMFGQCSRAKFHL